jgi:hypothetical protein
MGYKYRNIHDVSENCIVNFACYTLGLKTTLQFYSINCNKERHKMIDPQIIKLLLTLTLIKVFPKYHFQ